MRYSVCASEPRAWHASDAKGIAGHRAGSLYVVATAVQGSTNGMELSRPTSTSTSNWFVGCFNFLATFYEQIYSYLPAQRAWEARQYHNSAMRAQIHFRGVRDCHRQRWPRSQPHQGSYCLVRCWVCSLRRAHPFELIAMRPNTKAIQTTCQRLMHPVGRSRRSLNLTLRRRRASQTQNLSPQP